MTDATGRDKEKDKDKEKEKDKNKLSHIGPKSAAWLRQVGIRTLEDVQQLGAMAAYLKVKRAGFKPGLNVLYALVGAEQSRPMNSLSPEEKAALGVEVDAFDDAQKQAKKQIFEVRDVTAERTAEGPQHLRLRTARGGSRDGNYARDPRETTPDVEDSDTPVDPEREAARDPVG